MESEWFRFRAQNWECNPGDSGEEGVLPQLSLAADSLHYIRPPCTSVSRFLVSCSCPWSQHRGSDMPSYYWYSIGQRGPDMKWWWWWQWWYWLWLWYSVLAMMIMITMINAWIDTAKFCDKFHLQAVVNLLVLHWHVVEVNQPSKALFRVGHQLVLVHQSLGVVEKNLVLVVKMLIRIIITISSQHHHFVKNKIWAI
jgi:hypothetical protein